MVLGTVDLARKALLETRRVQIIAQIDSIDNIFEIYGSSRIGCAMSPTNSMSLTNDDST